MYVRCDCEFRKGAVLFERVYGLRIVMLMMMMMMMMMTTNFGFAVRCIRLA